MEQGRPDRPFFSVGITTYNRPDLLREAIHSILSQPFGDFEILIGNDYQAGPISDSSLGIHDPRVRIVNHPKNLGEYGNLNFLWRNGRGRYFTWLADDDLHTPWFMTEAHRTLAENDFPPCLFSDFSQGSQMPGNLRVPEIKTRVLSGPEFLHQFMARKISSILVYGFFDRERIFPAEKGDILRTYRGVNLYADPQLSLKLASAERVFFLDAPLVFFRTHAGSFSYSTSAAESFVYAQSEILQQAVGVFRQPNMVADFDLYLRRFLRWRMEEVFSILGRHRHLRPFFLFRYAKMLNPFVAQLDSPRLFWLGFGRLYLSTVGRALYRRVRARLGALLGRGAP